MYTNNGLAVVATILISTFFLVHCRERKAQAALVPRDTTITPVNAVTPLRLDSLFVDAYIRDHELDEENARRLRNFYNSRNYQFAWFTEDGLAEQAHAFWSLHNQYLQLSRDSSLSDQELHRQMKELTEEGTVPGWRELAPQLELQLTGHFFEYAQYAYAGRIDPEELQWHIPRKKVDAVALLDSLIRYKGQKLEDWESLNEQYRALKEQLLRLYATEKKGGWEVLPGSKDLYRSGRAGVPALKRRLAQSGDGAATDTSDIFTSELKTAVAQAQRRFGQKETGQVTADLLRQLNVPLEERIGQVLINMERMRWLPRQREGRRILVNIPGFRLRVMEGAEEVLGMKIVVGKAGSRTVVFQDEVKHVVFSPYWNVPRSIVRNEILPAMQRNPNYLAKNNMEQTGTSGGLPVIRQKPGPGNALGKVKFIFPNSYNIYLHDTPAKSLFSREQRAFSHGCIRLEEPFRLAQYLLKGSDWTDGKIRAAMNAGEEKWVPLKEPVPVFISYFTAWVDEGGLLHFRDDIYGHDRRMAERLFCHAEH